MIQGTDLPAAAIPDAEAEWRSGLPPALQPVGLRHGRDLFALCMNCLSINEQVGIMRSKIKAQDAQQRLTLISQSCNNIANMAGNLIGATPQTFQECTMDIQRAMQLMNATAAEGAPQSAGGIILPH